MGRKDSFKRSCVRGGSETMRTNGSYERAKNAEYSPRVNENDPDAEPPEEYMFDTEDELAGNLEGNINQAAVRKQRAMRLCIWTVMLLVVAAGILSVVIFVERGKNVVRSEKNECRCREGRGEKRELHGLIRKHASRTYRTLVVKTMEMAQRPMKQISANQRLYTPTRLSQSFSTPPMGLPKASSGTMVRSLYRHRIVQTVP